jgi:nitrite reductase/ring-hydroxylating ferredoxin subunit
MSIADAPQTARAPGHDDGSVTAPPASAFAVWPTGWVVLAASDELSRRPVSRSLFGRRIVGYRTADGRPVALDARCWHMGSDLGQGDVVGDCVRCPFHGWRFGPDGRCTYVPAQDPPPAAARQPAYATAEAAGRVFVFPSDRPTHPLPFFDGIAPGDLLAASPFAFRLRCPWWLVGTNGFDVQHFLGAHDRRLVEAPTVSVPHPMARRVVATFDVVGRGWRDRLTRRLSGPRVTMDVTVWAGSLVFVQARFRRTTSYGMVEVRPDAPGATPGNDPTTVVRVTIFVRRRPGPRAVLDPLDVRVRRHFIRAFLEPDAQLLDGARYRPERLVEADRLMAEYLAWLAPASHGTFGSEEAP